MELIRGNVQEGLRRGRQIVAAVINPEMRRSLNGDGDELSRFDWVKADGTIEVPQLRQTLDAIEQTLDDAAILHFDRIKHLPADDSARLPLSLKIVAIALERLGSAPRISEERLNAALAMLVEDVAVVRRDAVNAGALERTADGRVYTARADVDRLRR